MDVTSSQPAGLPEAAVADRDVDPREAILEVKNLRTSFSTAEGVVHAVDNVSFNVRRGEALALVGESGCGKSVTAMSIMRLVAPPGRITGGRGPLQGTRPRRALRAGDAQRARQRHRHGVPGADDVAQSRSSRSARRWPRPIRIHRKVSKKEAWKRAGEMLELVSIPDPIKRLDDYPHQLSGGMRQRVMIAMALSCDPELLIADEPTTALDVTIQAQIMELLASLQQRLGLAILLITHDLGVVAEFCERVIVMYTGRVVEESPVRDLFANPAHPYTRGLLKSLPSVSAAPSAATRLPTIKGMVPPITNLPRGCKFNPRCPDVMDICLGNEPARMIVGAGT